MIDYMRDGGWGMWAILLGAVGFAGYAMTRPREQRSGVFFAGCVFVIIQGVLGMATGMGAVARACGPHGPFAGEDPRIIAVGLGELANNGTFSSALAMLLGLAAIVTRPKPATTSPAAS